MKIKIHYERLYSVPEIAIILDICEATVRSWIKTGKINAVSSSSNRPGFRVKGSTLRGLLHGEDRFNWRDDTVDIPDERRTEYLMAAKSKCMVEIDTANATLRREMEELNEILKEIFKDEES